MNFKLLLFLLLSITSCNKSKLKIDFALSNKSENIKINTTGNTVKTRFSVPKGFKRINTQPNTFENYLQNFKLKPSNSKVYLYNGNLKYNQQIHAAVLDINTGKRDLQQCADATMRLRAEFLYQQKRFNDIHFKFTNGFNVAYSKWRKGFRLNVKGNKVSWYKTDKPSTSYKSFQKYMQWIFMYAGTLSLSKELKTILLEKMKIGDIFIQGGSPGHAIIIVDMAKNKTGKTLFMIAQSYMPAQDIHILKNLNNKDISPWYSSKNLETLNSPEWQFTKNDLKRFD